MVHHIPTDEDISDLLTEFTVDFLLKGYSALVYDIKKQLLSDVDIYVDKSHFLWLITYFLKFASQLEVELEQIGYVTFKIHECPLSIKRILHNWVLNRIFGRIDPVCVCLSFPI